MKKASVVLIIVWSVVAVALTAVLIAALTGNFLWAENGFVFNLSKMVTIEPTSGEWQKTGGSEIAADDIKRLEIDWIAGEVVVTGGGDGKITVTEYCRRALKQGEEASLSDADGKLVIGFKADRAIRRMPAKRLEINVPDSLLAYITLESASADVSFENISASEVECENVSGRTVLNNINAQEIDISSVSGDIRGEILTCGEFSADNVSGKVGVSFTACPRSVDIETVSGEMLISLPENSEFSLSYDKVSGNLVNEFPTVPTGECKLSAETVSGNLTVAVNDRGE